MSIHLLCLTDTGLPIFTRKVGDCDSLPFSTIGSLNGVHLFCKTQGVKLIKTDWEDGVIVWEEFDDLMLIGIGRGIPVNVIRNLLIFAHNAMILSLGLNELQMSRNPERLKRELRTSLTLIDKLLEESCELINFSDCLLNADNSTLLDKLNEFSEQFGSPYACLMVKQKIAVATEGWWDLNVIDRKLLITLLATSSSIQKDVPVFLPKKSPNVAYRLISVPIIQNVNLLVLCGAEPSFLEIQNLAQHVYSSSITILQNCERNSPRNLPESIDLDPGIMAYILINKTFSKCATAKNLPLAAPGKRTLTNNHHLDLLRNFFHKAVDLIDVQLKQNSTSKSVQAKETYWSSDYYKLHALIRQDNIFCVMYASALPTHTMRLITQTTLDNILASKEMICW